MQKVLKKNFDDEQNVTHVNMSTAQTEIIICSGCEPIFIKHKPYSI